MQRPAPGDGRAVRWCRIKLFFRPGKESGDPALREQGDLVAHGRSRRGAHGAGDRSVVAVDLAAVAEVLDQRHGGAHFPWPSMRPRLRCVFRLCYEYASSVAENQMNIW